VRHRLVEGHAGDGEVDAGEVLGVAAAQERGGAAERVLECRAAQIGAGEGYVDLRSGLFQ
jgi:hypothetical protein